MRPERGEWKLMGLWRRQKSMRGAKEGIQIGG